MSKIVLHSDSSRTFFLDGEAPALRDLNSRTYVTELQNFDSPQVEIVQRLRYYYYKQHSKLYLNARAYKSDGDIEYARVRLTMGDYTAYQEVTSIDPDNPTEIELSVPLEPPPEDASVHEIQVILEISGVEGGTWGTGELPESLLRVHMWNTEIAVEQNITGDVRLDSGNVFVNYYGPDDDSFVFFYDNGSCSGQYLQWYDASGMFKLSNDLTLSGDLYLNYDGPDGDSCVYFYEGEVPTSGWLKWDHDNNRIECSHDFLTWGDLKAAGDIGLNVDQGDVDAKIDFYKPGSGHEELRWDKTDTRFEFSDTLSMETHKVVNVVDPTEDQDAATKKYVDDNATEDGTFWHPDLSGKLGAGEHPQYAPSGEYVGLSGNYITHRDDTTNPHEVTFTQTRTQEGGSDVTLAELEELTDGSETTLHSHSGSVDFTGPILIMNAMWLDDDEGAPLTSRLSGTYSELHDGDKTTEAKYQATTKWSIGVDLGVTRDIARLKLYDDPADQNHPADTGSGWGGIYPTGDYDSLEIYTADINGAWTLRETVHPVPRLPAGHGRPCTIDIELSGTYTCRFIKAYCNLGPVSAVNGGAIGMAEIECLYD